MNRPTHTQVEDLCQRIESMTLADRLRLAAQLLDTAADHGGDLHLARIAHSLIDRTATQLGAVLALRGES